MPKVIYEASDGTESTIEVASGTSVMRGAKENGVDGIEADCGGVCACATCHVYVDPQWAESVGGPGEDEAEMLECANDPGPTSRLSCQIEMTDALDGLKVRLPDSQR
ncbi:MAG: 2Fe-2S iron-sulfur cluster-binding protein [Parasphingopyxis sp.]|uniref:2Fe-2S iron-sulfur cluster-binding protein n=1 Tax=Parasphingopyxis sp. TaxID=1920299 RepID=UPI0032F02F24